MQPYSTLGTLMRTNTTRTLRHGASGPKAYTLAPSSPTHLRRTTIQSETRADAAHRTRSAMPTNLTATHHTGKHEHCSHFVITTPPRDDSSLSVRKHRNQPEHIFLPTVRGTWSGTQRRHTIATSHKDTEGSCNPETKGLKHIMHAVLHHIRDDIHGSNYV